MTDSIIENLSAQDARLSDGPELRRQVEEVVNRTAVIDVHTHLFAPEFGDMILSGIDELLTYHYLIAELFRSTDIAPERFWHKSKTEQADLIWRTLFVENTPLSEAARGVVTVLNAFGLDTAASDLAEARDFFRSQNFSERLDRVFDLARVSGVVMTNDPFDAREAKVWESGAGIDKRFHAALRIDPLLNDWQNTSAKLSSLGYRVDASLSDEAMSEARRFLDKWIARMKPLYMAVSLPDDFKFPDSDARDRVIRELVLPTAREHSLPFTMMIGVRRGVNPALRGAGDGVGRASVGAVERLCADNPDVRFMATFLSRENQHELCVAARKFGNLQPFGCWWFLNNPSIISEITRERIELLGTSFIPQHSDACILEQLIYKWQHSRRVIAESLCEAYERLLESGRAVTRREIERDVRRVFSGNFLAQVSPAAARAEERKSLAQP
ncbi:MAG: glucuronate isomerase [Blastocatellia bacterium]|nr:glucuronate isomerase [Blastocatellia bacterium]